MPKPWRLSAAAERQMEEIGAWTVQHFGPDQADRYIDELVTRCDALAEGRLPHLPCRQQFAADLRADLRFIRAGKHFVFFIETAAEFRVVAIIHQSMDVAQKLRENP